MLKENDGRANIILPSVLRVREFYTAQARIPALTDGTLDHVARKQRG